MVGTYTIADIKAKFQALDRPGPLLSGSAEWPNFVPRNGDGILSRDASSEVSAMVGRLSPSSVAMHFLD